MARKDYRETHLEIVRELFPLVRKEAGERFGLEIEAPFFQGYYPRWKGHRRPWDRAKFAPVPEKGVVSVYAESPLSRADIATVCAAIVGSLALYQRHRDNYENWYRSSNRFAHVEQGLTSYLRHELTRAIGESLGENRIIRRANRDERWLRRGSFFAARYDVLCHALITDALERGHSVRQIVEDPIRVW